LEICLLEDIYDELELIGFPVSATTFNLLKRDYRGTANAKGLIHLNGQTVNVVCVFVCDEYVRAKAGAMMKFGAFFDVIADFVDSVIFRHN